MEILSQCECDPRPRSMPSSRQGDQTWGQSHYGLILPTEKHNWPFVGAHPPLHPAAAPSSFFYGGRSFKIFFPTLFYRSLFMMHLWGHLTQQSTLLLLEMEQIWALTTMFAVEGSSGNNCGDNNNGWESNDGCNAMVMRTRAWALMVMTPTDPMQNHPMLTHHLSKATGLLKNWEQS
jgi:hypothetical protein